MFNYNIFTKQQLFILLFVILNVYQLHAQPSNNSCYTPIIIPASSSWCSTVEAYTNVGATPSGYGPATCFGAASNDVWFSFVAVGTDVTINVIGNQPPSAGGTLTNPQVALYQGSCGGTINQLQCGSANLMGTNVIEIYKGGLVVGQTYLIRVQGNANSTGTFQICMNNYNAPAEPGSDCVSASVLCDKSPFVVQSVTSAGNDPDEAVNSCLGGLGGNSESNSTWFKWTCEQSGTLTFTLTPNNASDDLDFVVYELPGGLNDCNGKIEERCMAAGDFNYPSPCMGPTGLNLSSTDFTETSGCGGNKDNFVAALNMVAGKSYALMVNNFSATGNGFAVSFGGSGTFRGPTADFSYTQVGTCAGEDFTFQDASSFPFGTITGRTWSFGVDATTPTANTIGPHTLSYTSAGTKYVTLTVETDLGCIVTDVALLEIDSCCETLNAINYNATVNDVDCRGNASGDISLLGQTGGLAYSYLWSNGQTTFQINNLVAGDYEVTVTNGICTEMDTFSVVEPPAWEIDADITRPTCDGGTDGAINLTQVAGSNGAPYQFNWDNNGFNNDMAYTNLSNGLYSLVVEDVMGCDTTMEYDVHEVILDVDFQLSNIVNPSCYGYNDGLIEVEVLNGLAPYTFAWSSGDTTANLYNLTAGTYRLDTIWDANRCRSWETDTFDLVEPDTLVATADSVMVSCFGDTDGILTALVSGGTYPYYYNWSNGMNDSIATGLAPNFYQLTVTDNNGCLAYANATIDEPLELFIDSLISHPTTCFGYGDGSIEAYASGGRPWSTGYLYSLEPDKLFSPSNIFQRPAGNYIIYAKDSMGCMAASPVLVEQPLELIVDAGEDIIIEMGDEVTLFADLNYIDYYDYLWYPNDSITGGEIACPTCRETEVLPYDHSTYFINVTNEAGCVALDSVTILLEKDRDIFIPNAFSPNGDGNNDYLQVYSEKGVRVIKDYKVFDRWGNTVFHRTNIPIHWKKSGWDGLYNGQEMMPGVYAYVIEVEFLDGYIGLFYGDITLFR